MFQLFMEKILTEEIRYQDKSSAFASVYNGNLGNIDVALNYILANKPKWGAVLVFFFENLKPGPH